MKGFICNRCQRFTGLITDDICPHCHKPKSNVVVHFKFKQDKYVLNRTMKKTYGVSGFSSVQEANDYLRPMGQELAHKDEILETIKQDCKDGDKEIPLSPALEEAAIDVGKKIAKMNTEEADAS